MEFHMNSKISSLLRSLKKNKCENLFVNAVFTIMMRQCNMFNLLSRVVNRKNRFLNYVIQHKFFSPVLAGNAISGYFCTVFFIVLDLRLIRLGYRGIPFFMPVR